MIQEIAAIIDRSGSMAGKEEDTINGINTTIEELKKNKMSTETINFSVKFFDHQEELKIRSLNIDDVVPLKMCDLRPRGQTALLDAMGKTITYFINKKLSKPTCFESCIIYIATDGFENASKLYNHDNIKNLIINAKKHGIELLYLAANQDAILEASKFGLDSNNALNYSETPGNTHAAYRSASAVAKRRRLGNACYFLPSERSDSVSQL